MSPPDPAASQIVLAESESDIRLRDVLVDRPSALTLAIGPEGGWTDEEFASATAAGFREASLGKLILRTETAVIAALASLNYALQA